LYANSPHTDGRGDTIRLVSVVGARPQFIKAFPFSKAVRANPGFEEVLVHTGQHYDANMSDVFFTELGIPPPRYQFDIHGGSHGAMTGRMLAAIEEALIAEKPDAVLVYGDTNSTLAGALAAAKLAIPIVHVEAGLRSFNRNMPEEINRIVADRLSSVLLCPTSVAMENLAREGITQGVHKTGDLMNDATLLATGLAEKHSNILERLGLAPRAYGVATIHRAENTDDPEMLDRIAAFIAAEAQTQRIVLPLHPRTRDAAKAAGVDFAQSGISLIDPVGYLDMCRLLQSANIVLTDSGGLQKEAYFHRVPCTTLRNETEWVETVECGWNKLWTVPDYRPRRPIPDYGDGHAAEEILGILSAALMPTKK
jgi:UDP-GlcNAc3NAcA epimerase